MFDIFTGTEPLAQAPPILPSNLDDLDARDLGYVSKLLYEGDRPVWDLQPLVDERDMDTFDDPFFGIALPLPEQWVVVTQLNADAHNVHAAARSRWAAVKQKITEQCQAGSLRTLLRPRVGGTPLPMDRDLWNTEVGDSRIESLTCNLAAPFDEDALLDESAGLLYVNSEDLTALLLKLGDPLGSNLIPEGISPYLVVLLRAHRQLKLSAEHQPLKREVVRHLETMRTEFPSLELSADMLDRMATILREPLSGKGKNRASI